ncbi:MFS transporter [Kitasatospora aureofaciens]|uniref:MFS transporter n=1 Tax=Kitasatospora aureofaciens TaxID=1894 RepID=UPI001C474A41|nr:MFS transporter [Kitasatospora aureofaciens]MBV6695583.1 MFS transporter [Kitasatospora aureofaciens]
MALPHGPGHKRSNRKGRHRVPPSAEGDWLLRCYVLRATDALASAVITYAVPLLVLTLTHSPTWTGLAFLLEWVPRLAAITGAGPLIDRYRPQSAVLGTSLLRITISLATLIGLAAGAGSWLVITFGVVCGMIAQGSFLACESIGGEASRRAGDQAHRVQAVMTGIDQAGLLLGPLIGGLLLLAGPALLLATVAILSTVTATVALTVHAERPRLRLADTTPVGSLFAGLPAGLGVIRRTPALAWLVGALAATNLAVGLLQVSAPITVTRHLHHSTAAVGLVWSIAAAASLAAVAYAHRAIDRHGLFRVGAASAAVICAATLASALAPTLATYATAVATLMAADGAATVVLRTARARLIPERRFAATLATTVLLVLAPLPLAGLLVALRPAAHLQALVVIVALGVSAATAACLRGLHQHRDAWDPADEDTTTIPLIRAA